MPEARLAPLLDLYKRVKNKKVLEEPYQLSANEQMNRDVKWLNYWRNEFVHFVPQGLSLEVSGMPRIIRNCCEVIDHLAVKHPTFWHTLDEPHFKSCPERVKTALSKLRVGLDTWEADVRGGESKGQVGSERR